MANDKISQVTLPNGTTYDIEDIIARQAIPFGQVDSTSTATAFTATVPGITELKDGVIMLLKNGVITSASGFTININGLGAKPVYSNMAAATRETTLFNVNYTLLFIYDEDRVSGGCWINYRGYYTDSNSIGYQLRTNNTVMNVSDTARYYKIYFTSADGTMWVPASVNSTNNATSARAVNQRPINPFGRIVYTSASTNYTAGSNLAATTAWSQYTLVLGYSFNRTGAALELSVEKPVYIKCAPQSNGSAIIDADTPYVQVLPSTADGKIYIYLGIAYDETHVELYEEHPIYWYDGTGIRLWTGKATTTINVDTALSTTSENPVQNKVITNALPVAATTAPIVDGTATVGTSTKYAREDHIHPKATYTASEVGLGNVDNVQQYSASNPPPYPVTSVNSQTGAVSLSIPTKTSDLTNDSGYTTNVGTITGVTAGSGLSGGGSSGSVTLNHSNSVTAQTTQALYPVKIDAQGHISAYGTAVTSLPASDVSAWAKAANKPTYTASEVGAVATSAVGAANGVVPLNASSKIDETYLPSYVDDVVEGYYYNSKFYKESSHTTEITGEAGKIYIDLATDKTYRYGGSVYAELGSGSVVSVSRDLTTGTKSATITVNGTGYDIYSVTNTDKEVKQSLSTSNDSYAVLLRADTGTTTSTGETKFSSSVSIQPSTGNITAGKINNYTLAAACAKSVDTSISAGSSSANLPTSAAVASFVEGKGYITSYTETDPIFSASAAAGITSSDITNWNSKTSNTGTVTKVTAGTGLKIGTASSGGDITTTGTINHINSVTAQNTQALYPIKIDAQGHISAYGTAVTSLPASDVYDWAKAATKPTYTATEVGALPSTTTIPSKTSDLTNDSGFITGMFIASYGSSTYADVLAAYQANKVVYCRASSAANPSSGNQLRMAFLAYVNNQTTPTEFEFQYYRSVSTHSDAQQGDQIFIYKLNSSGTWSVTTREAYSKMSPSTGLTKSYSSGTLTFSVTNPLPALGTAGYFLKAGASGPEYSALTSSEITTVLGYTPYDSDNPQGFTDNIGTITGIKVNSVALSIDTDGTIAFPNATTSAYGIVQLSNSTSSTSDSLAATASAVKAAYDNGGVQSVNSYTGAVTLGHDDVGVYQGTTAPSSMASSLNTGDIYVYTPGSVSGSTYTLDENFTLTGDITFGGTVSGLTAEDVHVYVGTTAPSSMASSLENGDIYIYLSTTA